MKKLLVILMVGLFVSQPLSAYQGRKNEGSVYFDMYDRNYYYWNWDGSMGSSAETTTTIQSVYGSHSRYIAASGTSKTAWVGHGGFDQVTGNSLWNGHYHIVGSIRY